MNSHESTCELNPFIAKVGPPSVSIEAHWRGRVGRSQHANALTFLFRIVNREPSFKRQSFEEIKELGLQMNLSRTFREVSMISTQIACAREEEDEVSYAPVRLHNNTNAIIPFGLTVDLRIGSESLTAVPSSVMKSMSTE